MRMGIRQCCEQNQAQAACAIPDVARLDRHISPISTLNSRPTLPNEGVVGNLLAVDWADAIPDGAHLRAVVERARSKAARLWRAHDPPGLPAPGLELLRGAGLPHVLRALLAQLLGAKGAAPALHVVHDVAEEGRPGRGPRAGRPRLAHVRPPRELERLGALATRLRFAPAVVACRVKRQRAQGLAVSISAEGRSGEISRCASLATLDRFSLPMRHRQGRAFDHRARCPARKSKHGTCRLRCGRRPRSCVG